MGAIEEKTRAEVKALGWKIKEMSVDMRIVSLTMKSLYAEKAVGTNVDLAKMLRKLRDESRDDALVYLKGILPIFSKFAPLISEYFEYYEALDFDQWCDMIADILADTVGYRQFCEALLKMHEDILVPLKQRKDQAMLMITEFRDLGEEYETQRNDLEAAAKTKRRWAWGLRWTPDVNLIASPLPTAGADSDLAEVVAMGKQAQISEVASITVVEILIFALEKLIDDLRKGAGFFSAMEQELRKLEGKAEKSQSSPKQLYYKVMNKEAQDMKSICQIFNVVLPDIRADFLAIPQDGTNQNYVGKWLAQQKRTIREKCSLPKLVQRLLEATIE